MASGVVDFSPLQNALAGYRSGLVETGRHGDQMAIGNALAGPGGVEAARKIAAERGDLQTNLGLANFATQQRRDQREEENFRRERQKAIDIQFGKIGQSYLAETDPAKADANWKTWRKAIDADPDLNKAFRGLVAKVPEFENSPRLFAEYVSAVAAPYRDALAKEALQADIDAKRAAANKDNAAAAASTGKLGPLAEAAAKEEGEGIGKARVALPDALNAGATMLRNMQAVLDDKGLDNVVGVVAGHPWAPTVRQSSANTQARLKQIQGQTFMQIYQTLKGGGTITEQEGAKAQQGFARLNDTRISPNEYRAALRETMADVSDLMYLARAKSQGQGAQEVARIGALREARDAIARGAAADKVQERLRENGIDPSRL